MFFKERKIVKDLIVRAGRGQAEAEFELAKRHMSGKGVKQDIIKALELYEDSAKHGSVPAQLALGELYFNGVEELFTDKRIDRDYEKAAYYYEKPSKTARKLPKTSVCNSAKYTVSADTE